MLKTLLLACAAALIASSVHAALSNNALSNNALAANTFVAPDTVPFGDTRVISVVLPKD